MFCFPYSLHYLAFVDKFSKTEEFCSKTTPPCNRFPAVLSGTLMLASALAEDTLTRQQGPEQPSLELSIGNALKILAEAVVNVSRVLSG